jgi:hypothetical protein
VRAIAIGAAIFLVAVASASGARSTPLTQKPMIAPQNATRQIVCTSASACVSVGGSYVLVEKSGKWTAVRAGGSVGLSSVACSAAGKCVAAGRSGERRAVLLDQDGAKWDTTVATLPGKPADPAFPGLSSVSCAAGGECTAVGAYDFPLETPIVVKKHDGVWSNDTAAPLPANAATTRDPNHTNAGGNLSFVACPSASSCTAVGTYTNKDAEYGQSGWVLSDTSNRTAFEAQLPAGAALAGDSERGGTSPFFGFSGLACPSVGTCTAVGGYVDDHDHQQGVIFMQHGGIWSRGVKAPVPTNAGANGAPSNEFVNPLTSLSCAAKDDCAAVGSYVDRRNRHRGLLLTERSGKWKASELVLPVGAPAGSVPTLNSVTCAGRGDCVAVGYYASAGKTYGLFVVERGGKWWRASNAALPWAARAHTFLNSISCPSLRSCTAVGDYADKAGNTRGLILNLRFH